MRDQAHARPSRRALLLALGVLPAVAACGASPQPQGPGGVDDLVVPTPTPDPGDFVATVDNPWLPLAPGSRWAYAVRPGEEPTVRADVAERATRIAGLSATALVWTRGAKEFRRDWFAQDTRGNVWQVGSRASASLWVAGRAGAQAGLAMPATPRRGDGFRPMLAPGIAEDRITVVAVDARPPDGLETRWADGGLLQLERTMLGGDVQTEFYHREVGLVARTTEAGAVDELLLVDHTGSGD